MKIYAPKYYNDFKCIASACKHSCCIGWEIDVDSQSLKKYCESEAAYAKRIRESIDHDGATHFKLSENERCPHLDDSGLCNIITELSEEYLCDICREHPRFYSNTKRGIFAGLGMACEEAARIILSSDNYDSFIEISEIEGEVSCDFDAPALCDKIYAILKNKEIPYERRLHAIYEKFGVSPEIISDSEWQEELLSLEYLNENDSKCIFSTYTSETDTPPESEDKISRALAYFIYRHTSSAVSAEDFRASLGLALFLERLLATVVKADFTREVEELGRIVSEEIEYSEENTDAIKNKFM